MMGSGIRLSWDGRSEAETLAHQPSHLALMPDRARSFDWEQAHLACIEGDNLDALKALQPTLTGQVKLIYIDPPYNLGRPVLYRDQSGWDEWLSMMLPRLRLAFDLLREDGLLLISVDDHALPLTRMLMDDLFGEQHFLANFVWETKRAARGRPPTSMLMSNHEYVVAYAKDPNVLRLRGLDRNPDHFKNPDQDPRGPWRSESMKATGGHLNEFFITDPHSGAQYFGSWAFSEAKVKEMIQEDLILFPSKKSGVPRQKKHLNAYLNQTKAGVTSLGWHSSEAATRDLIKLFDGEKVFPFSKPLSLLQYFIDQQLNEGDLIIDFFAGSGSTGHAVWAEMARRGIALRCILIQRPEEFDLAKSANRGAKTVCEALGLPLTISSITIERLRRAARCFPQLTTGLRVFTLKPTEPQDHPEENSKVERDPLSPDWTI